jgi:hypothetical protein
MITRSTATVNIKRALNGAKAVGRLHLTALTLAVIINPEIPFSMEKEDILVKRIKKPTVKPEMRRHWLRRYEEEGESPPQIAKADGYDVRTVRKQIEIERQERERREARSVVLRHALEQHYADLCAFAQKLDSAVADTGSSLTPLKDERMWSALREHLPRSVIWKNLDRRRYIRDEIRGLEYELEKKFGEQLESRSGLKFSKLPEKAGLDRSAILALISHLEAVAREQSGLLSRANFTLIPIDEKLTDIHLGAFYIGRIPNKQVPNIKKLVSDLLSEIITWEEYYKMRRLVAELDRIQRVLRDELAVIILRRVVPGRCRYCPI